MVVHERNSDSTKGTEDGYKEPERIVVIGTCHLSLKSAADVKRVIHSIRPENVVVELCKSRTALLYDLSDCLQESDEKTSNPFVLSGSSFADTVLRTVKLGGASALFLRLTMGSLAQRISHTFKVKSGVEMRAAQQAADQIGAEIVLGDRPIEITMQQAMGALSLPGRFELLSGMFRGMLISQREMTSKTAAMKVQIDEANDDLVYQWTKQLTDQFPELAGPLIHERDLYLAWSMKRSKAVNGARCVVGVIGRGHLRGVYYALQHDKGELKFRKLVGAPHRMSRADMVLSFSKRLVFELLIGCACYCAWMSFSHNGFGF